MEVVMKLRISVIAKNTNEYDQFSLASLGEITRYYGLTDDAFKTDDVCIVLSPMTDEERDILVSNQKQIKIVAFIGTKLFDVGISIFKTKSELELIVQGIKSEKLNLIQSHYIDHATVMTEEDFSFLKTLKGESDTIKSHKKRKRRLFKSLYENEGIVALVGNTERAFQMVNTYVKRSKNTAVFVDGHLLKPTLDVYYGTTRIETKVKSHLTGIDNSGINIIFDAFKKGVSFTSIKDQVMYRASENLDVLFGNYNIFNYEHYDHDLIEHFLQQLKQVYSMVFIVIDENIYDAFGMLVLHLSDIQLIYTKQNVFDVRYQYQVDYILENRQSLDMSKRYMIFEKGNYKVNLPNDVVKSLFKKRYIGTFGKNHAKKTAKYINQLLEKRS